MSRSRKADWVVAGVIVGYGVLIALSWVPPVKPPPPQPSSGDQSGLVVARMLIELIGLVLGRLLRMAEPLITLVRYMAGFPTGGCG